MVLPERGGDLRDEAVEVAAQLVQRPEHGRDEERLHAGRAEPVELLPDLLGRAGQTGVPRVVGMASGDGAAGARGMRGAQPASVRRGSAAGTGTSGSFSSRRTMLAPSVMATHL